MSSKKKDDSVPNDDIDDKSFCTKKLKKSKKLHKDKHKKKKKKTKRYSSPSESDETKKSRLMKKKSKEKRKNDVYPKTEPVLESVMQGPLIPVNLVVDQLKSKAPMTKEEWEKSQSVIRKVYDETTGRTRLIKGDGEVLEEIVSKEKHQEINRNATKSDGGFFQSHLRVERNS